MKNVEKFFQYSNSTIIYVYISFSFLTFSYYDIEIIPCLQLVNVSHSPAEKKKIHTNKKNTSANDRYTIDNSSLKTLLPYSDLLLCTIHSPSEPPRATRQPRKARPGRPPAARWRWRAPSPRTFWARSGTAASLTLSSRSVRRGARGCRSRPWLILSLLTPWRDILPYFLRRFFFYCE